MKRFYLFVFLFTAFVRAGYSQRDTAFWFAVPEVSRAPGSYSTDLDTAIYLRITAFGQATTVTVTKPADPTFTPIIRTIAANKTTTVNLTPFKDILECKPPDQVLNYGLKITATYPISVYYEQACRLNPEIFTLKGQNALGLSFWIPGQDAIPNHYYVPIPYNSFDIIATEDNTSVTITNTQAITGHSAGSTYTVILSKGQTYSATAVTQQISGHLQGSRVTATKPIAITLKDDLLDGQSVWGQAHDLAGDQLVPDNVIGTEYIAVRGGLNSPYDKVFILATQNNTTISRDGAMLATVNAGTNYSFFMNNPSTYIQTNNPVYVVQMSGLGAEVSYGVLPPIVCTGSNAVAYVRSTTDPLYMMLLVRNGGQNNFRFGGNPAILPGSSFTNVPGTSGQWVSAKFLISTGDLPKDSAVMITNSTNLFHMGVVNGTSGGGGNFGYFSNYNSFVVTASNAVTSCGDTLYLHADSIAGATYSWTGPGGYTASVANPVRVHIAGADTGTYTLTAVYNGCTGVSSTYVSLSNAGLSPISLGSDTTYCSAFSRVLSTGHSGTVWSTGATGSQIIVSAQGTYWAQDNGACGFVRDSIVINALSPPTVNIGPDTSYCSTFSRALSAAPATALWSTGVTGTQITVSTPGTYWAQVSNQCGTKRDSAILTATVAPVVRLGADTSYCAGFSTVLSTAPDTALWSTGVRATQITVIAAGTYWAEESNCAGVARDSIVINITPPPSVALGADTVFCSSFSYTLATTPTATALWSTGATATQIIATSPGVYWAQVSGQCGTALDSILLSEIYPPVVHLGSDTTYCAGFSRVLSTAPDTGLWSTGAVATQITVTDTGTYWVQVTNCAGAARDSITITPTLPLSISLGADTSFCGPFSRVLQALPATNTALWSTGVSGPRITVSAAGIYWAEVTNCVGSARDSVILSEVPVPVIDLGPDDTICVGSVKLIGDSFPGASYIWSDGTTAALLGAPLPGLYIEEAAIGVCTWVDSIRLTAPSGAGLLLPHDTIICADSLMVLVPAIGYAPVWQDGSAAPGYYVGAPGLYYVTVQTACAPLSDSISVQLRQCSCKVMLPTAFSPNGDGLNDIYRIVYACPIENFRFAIYDRWGEKMYETTDPDEGWNGLYKNAPQPISVYAWVMSYRDPYENITKSYSGNVTLVR